MPEINPTASDATKISVRLGFRQKGDVSENRVDILERLTRQANCPNPSQFIKSVLDQLADVSGPIDLRDLTLKRRKP